MNADLNKEIEEMFLSFKNNENDKVSDKNVDYNIFLFLNHFDINSIVNLNYNEQMNIFDYKFNVEISDDSDRI